jgi:ABC-type amino acid transport substrate-binding protein
MHKTTLSTNTVVHREIPALFSDRKPGISALANARERGSLRIGYDSNNLPMSFFNKSDELVGFEIQLAEKLAHSLELKAEFVPINWPDMPRLLEEGIIDIMPGVWYRPFWFSSLMLTDPYFTATVGLATRDERRDDFETLETIRQQRKLKIGVPLDSTQIEFSLQHYFGQSDVEFVTTEFWNTYFEGKHPELDAYLMPAEHASGWSLLHPEYTVVVPQPNPVRIPSGFAVALDAGDLAQVINEWIVYAENVGIIKSSFDYWVSGQGAQKHEPRWSIMRNVLGWGDE